MPEQIDTRHRMRIVLASGSPQRKEILERLGLEFEVFVTDVEELSEGDPAEVVLKNARLKALAGARSGALTIGCDTDVALDGRLLGKPAGEEQARTYLKALSGRTHEVLSGLVVAQVSKNSTERPASPPIGSTPGRSKLRDELVATQLGSLALTVRTGVVGSRVTFHALEPRDIDRYIRSGEWRNRAGGYAIQGLGSTLVAGVEGDISNVIGLPVSLLLDLAPELAGGTAAPGRSGP